MKLFHRIALLVVLLCATVTFFSCAKAEKFSMGAVSGSKSMVLAEAYSGSAPEMKREASADMDRPSSVENKPQAASAKTGRKLVYTADLSIEAKDMPEAEKAIVSLIEKEGGYVASRSGDDSAVYLQFRLPAARLDSVVAQVAGTGKTLSKSMNAQDVTDQFFDLEGRLRNKHILQDRYRDYLKQAKTVEDMLSVEQKLSDTTNEIEWLEGSFRDLSKQIELSTLTVSLRPVFTIDPSRPGLAQSLGKLFSSFGYVVGEAFVVFLGILLYGIPAIVILAFVWFITFGRVGLVRKLFALVSKKK